MCGQRLEEGKTHRTCQHTKIHHLGVSVIFRISREEAQTALQTDLG